jgi:ankyrin repeat domain-containing protein 50
MAGGRTLEARNVKTYATIDARTQSLSSSNMDGLSTAASVIAVVQISGQVFNLCQTYYSEVKDARKDIQRLRNEVTSLQDVFINIRDLADAPSSAKLPTLDLLNKNSGLLQQCCTDLKDLAEKLESAQGKGEMKKIGARSLRWPFSKREVDKAIAAIERCKTTFSCALDADQAYVGFLIPYLALHQWSIDMLGPFRVLKHV